MDQIKVKVPKLSMLYFHGINLTYHLEYHLENPEF
jgi:hypothetical protein